MLVNDETKLAAFQKIVRQHQSEKVEGVLVDVQTANAIVSVCRRLSDENRASLLGRPVAQIGILAWKLVGTVVLFLAFHVLKPGSDLPPCDQRRQGDTVELDGTRYYCDYSLGQWLKQGESK